MSMNEYWVKSINDAAVNLAKRVAELEAENLKLKQSCGALESPKPLSVGNLSPSLVESEAGWKKVVSMFEADTPLAAENDRINSANATVVNRLRDAIVSAGIPATRRVEKRRKFVDEPVEWSSVLRVPKYGTGSKELTQKFTEWERRRNDFLKAKADKEAANQRAREREESDRKAKLRLLDICRELGIDPVESDQHDAEQAIRSRCKYLDLALAGSETRSDWSDGCYRVENALSRFKVESAIDGEIVSSWSFMCRDFEDGRCFRDCEWNYGKIMAELADKASVDLWNQLHE